MKRLKVLLTILLVGFVGVGVAVFTGCGEKEEEEGVQETMEEMGEEAEEGAEEAGEAMEDVEEEME